VSSHLIDEAFAQAGFWPGSNMPILRHPKRHVEDRPRRHP
jgi:hypothetical protein